MALRFFPDKPKRMKRFSLQAVLSAALLPFLACAHLHNSDLTALKLSELEQQLAEIDHELENLAALTLRRGVGALGYRSAVRHNPDEMEWIHIDLGEDVLIDGVALSPVLFRDTESGLQSEGFPAAFRILAGTGTQTNEMAVVTADQTRLPRIAPLTLDFPPVKASWIRLETTRLSPRLKATHYLLQLFEIMVFSGQENVALNRPVTVPPDSPKPRNSFAPAFVVDGFTPYKMDAAHGEQSKAALLFITETNVPARITIDLGIARPINKINLHSANLSYAVPMGNFTTWAVPRHVRIMGANAPDFSDETVLCEYRQETIYDHGPIIMRRFPETTCRYINIHILDHKPVISTPHPSYIAFSEIEVLSNGKNIALHAPVSTCSNITSPDGGLSKITDGLNYDGAILSQRDWMTQLSRRHELEVARPLIADELHHRYERQNVNLRRLGWLAGLLAAGIIIAILVERIIHLRQISTLQERFAADLHDEVGADLHTIGLLSDLADDSAENREALSRLLKEIRTTTEETGEAVRLVARLHSKPAYLNLAEMMQQIAERVVVQLEHEFAIEGAEHLQKLKPRTRSDLYLFYKEALINICRHAEATRLSTRLKATPRHIELTITDNGHGLPDRGLQTVPQSLRRRARLMAARVGVENMPSGGTCIRLTLKIRKPFPWRKQ